MSEVSLDTFAAAHADGATVIDVREPGDIYSVGATLYYFPQVFAVEAASQENLATIAQTFTSNTNPEVALWIMWASLAGVILVAGWIFFRAMVSAGRTMVRPSAPPAKAAPESTAVAD